MSGNDSAAVAVTGDTATGSFDDFYARDFAAVVRLAFVLIGKRPVAEEIAQDAFLAAYRHWDRIAGYRSPEVWVRRLTVNHCISTTRRATTEVKLVARLRRERTPEPTIAHDHQELWRLVRQLPRRQAQVIALVYLEDRVVDEVASILGCGSETVRTHLLRAKATLVRRRRATRAVGAVFLALLVLGAAVLATAVRTVTEDQLTITPPPAKPLWIHRTIQLAPIVGALTLIASDDVPTHPR